MCGILGRIGGEIGKARFTRALQTLKHRGPNDEGVYYDAEAKISLGHRRLSILDLSKAGKQPMWSADGRYGIIFNGEIYNYIEIKKKLRRDYKFSTGTDTEVILAAYKKWGTECLSRFNGMFAFALWDKSEQVLFCARDRLGIKPFYYTFRDGVFTFASEIKGLLALGEKPEANERVLYDYLAFGLYDHIPDETFFGGIKRLPAGHFSIWKDGKLGISRYWNLADTKPIRRISSREAEEKFRNLLADSIRLRFRSDVPVGVNLSSGLDSNTLLYYSKVVTKKDVHTFSMCLSSDEYNECSLIEQILNPRQIKNWHSAYLQPDEVFDMAERMNETQDEPYGGIPTIAYDKLNEAAAKAGVIVLLEGQGLDELLAGYAYYRPEHEKDIKKGNEAANILLSQDMTRLLGSEVLASKFLKKYQERQTHFDAPFNSHLLNAQYRDIVYTKIPRVLRFNDHASMAYGRELRLPYLDYRIVEFCFSLPANLKINAKEQKILARGAMKDIMPDIIRAKPKKAFGAIQNEWFRKYHRGDITAILSSPSFRNRPYWNHKNLTEKVKDFFAGKGDNSFFIWQAVNLELWFRRFVD